MAAHQVVIERYIFLPDSAYKIDRLNSETY